MRYSQRMPGTPPKPRDQLLAAPIAELAGYWLGVHCVGCSRSTCIPLKLMAAKRGRRTLLHTVLERLRCEHCKTSPASAWLVDPPIESGTHGGQVAAWRVNLLP